MSDQSLISAIFSNRNPKVVAEAASTKPAAGVVAESNTQTPAIATPPTFATAAQLMGTVDEANATPGNRSGTYKIGEGRNKYAPRLVVKDLSQVAAKKRAAHLRLESVDEAVGKMPERQRAMILDKLASDKDPAVRRGVAQHPRTTPSTLHKLASDKHGLVRVIVSDNRNTHPKTMHKLASDRNRIVRRNVAHHPNTSPKTLHMMASDKDRVVRRGVADHPNTNPKTLHKLASDKTPYVRRFVAQHPSTAPSTLRKLASDNDSDVSEVANRRLTRKKSK